MAKLTINHRGLSFVLEGEEDAIRTQAGYLSTSKAIVLQSKMESIIYGKDYVSELDCKFTEEDTDWHKLSTSGSFGGWKIGFLS